MEIIIWLLYIIIIVNILLIGYYISIYLNIRKAKREIRAVAFRELISNQISFKTSYTKNLTINVSPALHTKITLIAKKEDVSASEWISNVFYEKLRSDKK